MEDNAAIVLERAKFSDMIGRHEEMAKMMKKFVEMSSTQLDREQRNMLSLAYKTVIAECRTVWRNLHSQITKEEMNQMQLSVYEYYRAKLIEEIRTICNEVFELMDKHLIPKADDPEAKVFFLKMTGDYHRYLAEVLTDETRKQIMQNSEDSYRKALDIANKNLEITNPIRLGLALNFAVFYYEILKDPVKACELGKEAFDNAVVQIDAIKDYNEHKDITLILQLLKDNLAIWSSELKGDEEEHEVLDEAPVEEIICTEEEVNQSYS